MFADNLKKYREEAGLTQAEVAERVGVVRQTLSKWENGSSCPDIRTAVVLSHTLQVPLETLLADERDENEQVTHIKKDLRRKKLVFGTLCACSIFVFIVSVILFYNMSIFSDEYGPSPDLVCGGEGYLLLDWLRLPLSGIVALISGAKYLEL